MTATDNAPGDDTSPNEPGDEPGDEPRGESGDGAPRARFPAHLAAASGLLMGSADAVPGVSGGTIALIIGIYDRFIEALSTAVRAPFLVGTARGRGELADALFLLVPLGAGVVTAYYLVTKLLVGPADDPGVLLRPDTAPACYAFFFGLVLLSLREPWRRIGRTPGGASDSRAARAGSGPGWPHVALALAGCAAAALFVGLPYRTGDPALWTLALGGAGAIAVMLLPGVSGSLLLVILGQYTIVAGAVHDLTAGPAALRDAAVAKLGVFALGLVLGVLCFVPLLRFLLRRHHDLTMAALTGLMAGSLRALWPFKTNYQPKAGPMDNTGITGSAADIAIVLVALALGAAVVWLLARLEHKILAASSR